MYKSKRKNLYQINSAPVLGFGGKTHGSEAYYCAMTSAKALLAFALANLSTAFAVADSVRPVDETSPRSGLAVLAGDLNLSDGFGLAKGGGWLVLLLAKDDAELAALRKACAEEGVAGLVHVARWMDRSRLPLSDHMANLLIVEDGILDKAEVERVIVPVRGRAVLRGRGGSSKTLSKPMPKNMDGWTHFLHSATGNAVSNDTAVDVPNALRFIGGPRLQDNNGANAWRIGNGVALHEWNYPVKQDYQHTYMIEARDAFNGTLLWQRKVTAKDRMGGTSFKAKPFIVAGNMLVHVDSSGEVWQLVGDDIFTGARIKEYENSFDLREGLQRGRSPELPQMNVSGGKIYQSKGNMARCLDLQSGAVVWNYEHKEGDALAKPAVSDELGLIFFVESMKYKRGHGEPALNWSGGRYPSAKASALIAIDTETGDLRWRTPTDPRVIDWTKVEPHAVGKKGEKVSRDRLHLLNYKGGQLFTMFACDANSGNPSLVWALDAKTGKTQWVNAAGPFTDEKGHGTREMFNLFALGDGTLLTLGHAWCRMDAKGGKVLAFGSLAGNARCDTHSCTEGLVTAGFGNYFKVTEDVNDVRWTRRDLARGQCGGRSTPAYGMIFYKGSGCGCFDPIRGNLALHRAAAPKEIEETKRLEKGEAFGGVLEKRAGAGWSDYLGSASRSLSTPAAGPERLETLWSERLGDSLAADPEGIRKDWLNCGVYNGPLTAPVIAGGMVFVANRDGGRVVARDATTGEPRWTYTVGARVLTAPTYRHGRLVFGSRDGFVTCLDAGSGELAWKFFAAPEQRFIIAYGQPESAWPLHGCLPVVDGTVVASAGYHGEADGGVWVWGLSLEDGSVRWKKVLEREERQWVAGTPKTSREGFGELLEFRDQGHELASTRKRANGGYSVTLVRNIDLPAANGGVVRVARTPLDASTGSLSVSKPNESGFFPTAAFTEYRERFPFLDMEFEDRGGPHGSGGWLLPFGGAVIGDKRGGRMRIAHRDEVCYIAKPRYDEKLRTFGLLVQKVTPADVPDDGKPMRMADLPRLGFFPGLNALDSFIVAGDRAYVSVEGGVPHPWQKGREVKRQFKGTPVAGKIAVIDLKAGKEIGRIDVESAVINNGLAVEAGRLYAVHEDGTVSCFED